MNKNKKYKGYAGAGQPLFDNRTFRAYFEQRIDEMIKNSILDHFSTMVFCPTVTLVSELATPHL